MTTQRPTYTHGGPRAGSGRPSKPEAEKTRKVAFSLYTEDMAVITRLVELGYARNATEAVRRAVREALKAAE